jgi:hypothetical protein
MYSRRSYHPCPSHAIGRWEWRPMMGFHSHLDSCASSRWPWSVFVPARSSHAALPSNALLDSCSCESEQTLCPCALDSEELVCPQRSSHSRYFTVQGDPGFNGLEALESATILSLVKTSVSQKKREKIEDERGCAWCWGAWFSFSREMAKLTSELWDQFKKEWDCRFGG